MRKKTHQMEQFHAVALCNSGRADSCWTVRVEAELNLVDKNHSFRFNKLKRKA